MITMSLPVMVSVDQREVYQIHFPGVSEHRLRGVSLAELLDDAALYLMEQIPKESMDKMPRYQLCPVMELRKVKVTLQIPSGVGRKKEPWSGRFPVVVTRWGKDGFHVATVPTIGVETFAILRTAHLEEGLRRHLQTLVEAGRFYEIEQAVCKPVVYLEILEIETELPSILPSKPQKKKKKKKKPKKKEKKKKKDRNPQKRRMVPPETLRAVGSNLSHRAQDGRLKPAFGRDEIVDELYQEMQREDAAILLVGPSGVGKTAIIHELIRRFSAEEKPIQHRCDFWEVDGNRLISGMSMVGAWEQRCLQMVYELNARRDILYVNDLPSLVYAGRSASSDTNIAQFLEPHIAQGEFRIIGECTPERLEATREESPGFFARFRVVQISELSERETLVVLAHATRDIESQEECVLEPTTLESVLALTRRFQGNQSYPGKAITLLRQMVSDHHQVELDPLGRRKITREHLIHFFSRQSGLPSFILWEQQARETNEILEYFSRRIIAQTNAVDTVTDVVAVLQQGLNDPERPLATLLFVGPTGVGKTETAKALAHYLFGSKDRLLRFDMSEFMDPWSVSRLIGSRLEPDGELTRQVQQNPFSVVLFDEIEKAHPSLFDTLLQVLGEGRLTNASGHTVDFCNTVVIMTSNLGVRESKKHLGFTKKSGQQLDSQFREAAEKFFRPEFFNRIDRVVAFRSLTRDAISPLVRRLLQDILGRRGLRRSHVLVEVDPALVDLLVDEGFDPQYGARSMKRLLEQRLTVPLARHLVSQWVKGTTIVQLYPYGREIGMQVWRLEDEEVGTLRVTGDVERWGDLKPRYEQVKALVTTLENDETLQVLTEKRVGLLDKINEGKAELTEEVLFSSLSHFKDDMSLFREEIERFQERYMESFSFVEAFDKEHYADRESGYHWKEAYRMQVMAEDYVALDRKAEFPHARRDLHQLQIRAAQLLYRARSLDAPPDRAALLRMVPVTEDPSGLGWVALYLSELTKCWEEWGTFSIFACIDHQWCEWPPKSVEEWLPLMKDEFELSQEGNSENELASHHEEVQRTKARAQLETEQLMVKDGDFIDLQLWELRRPIKAVALEIRGAGIRSQLQEEEGYIQRVYHLGPDEIVDLFRLEEVGQEGVGSLDCLQSLQEEMMAREKDRHDGSSDEPPYPPLQIRRTFESGECLDFATNIHLRLPSLGADLFQVAMLRILADYLASQPKAEEV